MALYRNHVMNWSQQSINVDQFLEQYKDQLPVLVKISEENLETGRNWKSINSIYRVQKYEKQPRILARDKTNRLLSIPVDVPDKFQLVPMRGIESGTRRKSNYGHNPRLLKDIVGKEILPYAIKQVSKSTLRFHEGDEIILRAEFGELVVERVYGENFLVGNIISKGQMFPAVMVIPALLDMRVHVALGLADGGSAKEWLELQKLYNDFGREIDFQDQEDYDVYVKPGNEPRPVYPTIARSTSSTSQSTVGQDAGPLLPPRPPPTTLNSQTLRTRNRFLVPNTKSISSILDILDGEDLAGESTDSWVEYLNRRSQLDSGKPLASVPPTCIASSPTTDRPPAVAARPPMAARTRGRSKIIRRETRKSKTGSTVYIDLIDIDHVPSSEYNRSAIDEGNVESFKSLDEVPGDLEGLSVDEVAECLYLLKLGHVALLFSERLVDGALLKRMDIDGCKSEMGLTDFEASKLKSFVHDKWRPNLTRTHSARKTTSLAGTELSRPAETEADDAEYTQL